MTLTVPFKAPDDISVNGVAGKLDDVRRNLSSEAERLAEMAAQYSRDAGAHTADVAQHVATDVARDANSWLQQLLKFLGELGAAFTVSSRKVTKDASENAQSVAGELRKVRITTEPKSTGPDFTPGVTLLAGFGAGMALMYFLDPERGQERRQMVRDRITEWTRNAQARMNPEQTELWDSTSEIEPASTGNGSTAPTGTWPSEDLTHSTPV